VISTPHRILVAREHVDFRRGIAGLAAICELQLGEEPLNGTLFVFRNRRRTALKMWVWTHGGFLIVHKKLEKSRFRWPVSDTTWATITPVELVVLMEGIDRSHARRLSQWDPSRPSCEADRRR
jgi:transposase